MAAQKRSAWISLLLVLIPTLLGTVAWAADKYIDERIDNKLNLVAKRLASVEKKLDRIGYFLGVPEDD